MHRRLWHTTDHAQTDEGGAGMARWRLSAAARNHHGLLRQTNEDNFYLNGRWLPREAMVHGGRLLMDSGAPAQLYAVCDGTGPHEAAAGAAMRTVAALFALQGAHPAGIPDAALLHAMQTLTDAVARDGEALGAGDAGAALCACLWRAGRIRVLNIGHGRVYRLRGGVLHPLTVDHTEVQNMIEEGILTPDQARLSPRRHLLTQYIGLHAWAEAFRPYLSPPIPASPGDRYLLCSHGLVDMVEDAALRRALLLARTPGQAVDALVQQALDNGGQDNVTALCIFVQGSGGLGIRGRLAGYVQRMRPGNP